MEATAPRIAAARRYPKAGLATPHYLATEAGGEVLARGGNAIDAIVAANLVLGVVTPYLCGVGGDLFAMVWDGSLHGYLGAGRAPGAATPHAVVAATSGEQVPPTHRTLAGGTRAPGLGPHSVTVPQAIEGWFTLLERWGSRSFGDLATAAIRLAREGFDLTTTGAEMFAGAATIYSSFSAWNSRYGGLGPGARLHQPGLADLLELVASDGPEAYYRGPVAEAIVETVRADGGMLDEGDLTGHAGEFCDPLRAPYRDHEIAELPPPTQGVTALEILRILDGFDLAGAEPATRQHLIAEAVKRGLLDRDAYVTDPDHMLSPAGALLVDEHIAGQRNTIDPGGVADLPPGAPQRGGTAYLCAADGDGLLVSLIQSNFFAFGSGLHVARWGINLQNRGSSFSLVPGSVNVIAPAKRPMHTLIPAMVLRDGEPWLVFGSMGGDAQAQVHAQVLTRRIDDGTEIQEAIHAPRWRLEPDDWAVMRIEERFSAGIVDRLRELGHRTRIVAAFDSGMGHAHAIELTPTGYSVAVDPRCEGATAGQ